MNSISFIQKNTYFDSVTLMGISKKLLEHPDVIQVSVSMGTDMNKSILAETGFDADSVQDAKPNDVMVLCQMKEGCDSEAVLKAVKDAFSYREQNEESTVVNPKSLKTAGRQLPGANIAVISLPGAYAAFEARKALEEGLHVMLFSDNVPLESEIALKKAAHEKGLLVMGPDCGTSIINGAALCFANVVRRGAVGIVSASGTGAQEVSVLLDKAGIGISQLIGVGGRDLHKEVGGIMMQDALAALSEDPETEVILLLSKPPHPDVAEKMVAQAKACGKPVVICFLGGSAKTAEGNIHCVPEMAEAVAEVGRIMGIAVAATVPQQPEPVKSGYVRALFCGGTLCEEAKNIFAAAHPDLPVFSNIAKNEKQRLANPEKSSGHTFLDMGDDHFTRGKPHPMLDLQARNQRIVAEAKDPETAVLLLDFVLGYGANDDPVGASLEAIDQAQEIAHDAGRELVICAYVLGTEEDPQSYRRQCEMLERRGVIIGASNAATAATVAGLIQGE